MKPLIFLDIDGVLVTERYIRLLAETGEFGGDHHFDPLCVAALNRLIETADCGVVVSSTWRLFHDDMEAILGGRGINIAGRFEGCTPFDAPKVGRLSTARPRGREIAAWLKANKATERPLAILDDDADMEPLAEFLIQTKFFDGLTEALVDETLALLASQ